MVTDILEAAGFIAGQTYRETRFLKPPAETYAVFNDTFQERGADFMAAVREHDVTVELYEYEPDPEKESALEAEFSRRAVEFTKQERIWIDSEQLYQIIYEFSYIEKKEV